MKLVRTLICTLTACVLWACENVAEPPFVVDLPGSRDKVEAYLSGHHLQEAAWECIKLEQYNRADSILTVLEAVLRSRPAVIERWGGKGIMTNYLLTFENDIQGFFKVAGSDSLGPVRNETAAYAIDNLLRIHLTPITLIRDLDLQDGTQVRGVIKYFVKAATTAEDLELTSEQKPDLLIFFDTVIGNADRHLGNWMIRDDTKELIAIDHNRTFRFDLEWTWYRRMRTVRDPGSLGVPYDLFRSLPESAFENALAPHLDEGTIQSFLRSRSIVVRYLNSLHTQTSDRVPVGERDVAMAGTSRSTVLPKLFNGYNGDPEGRDYVSSDVSHG